MTAKHTPGPWLHDVMNDCTFMVREPGVLDHAIAHVDNVANARLIAAAPDLLEAARAALALIEATDHDDYFDQHKVDDAHEKLKAAIAKATGAR